MGRVAFRQGREWYWEVQGNGDKLVEPAMGLYQDAQIKGENVAGAPSRHNPEDLETTNHLPLSPFHCQSQTSKNPPPACCTDGSANLALCGVADFDRQLLPENSEGSLDLLGLGGVLGIEHTADDSLVEP